MDRKVAELVTAAAETVLAGPYSYWELQVRKEKTKITSILKRVEFWIKEVGKIKGGRGSMIERALKEARDNLVQTISLLGPLSQIDQLGQGIPSPSRRSGLRAA